MDTFPARPTKPAQLARSTQALVALLQEHLRPAERQTLLLLVAGVQSNTAIAEVRGVKLRSIQESRKRIRVEAAKLRNSY